jgi:hypothetical protein
MKESKFIELLNLFIDQQISKEDAAALEEEIMQNPRRRQIYSQYCRMHRACTMVLDRYNAQDETENPLEKIVAFEKPRSAKWKYYATGLAAAACVAFVAVQTVFRPGRAPSASIAAAPQPQVATAVSDFGLAMTPVRMEASGVRALSKTEADIARQLRLIVPMTAPANRVSLVDSVSRKPRILPLPAQNVSPNAHLSIEEFVFAHEPAARDDSHVFRARPSPDDRTANTAIEYQRQ